MNVEKSTPVGKGFSKALVFKGDARVNFPSIDGIAPKIEEGRGGRAFLKIPTVASLMEETDGNHPAVEGTPLLVIDHRISSIKKFMSFDGKEFGNREQNDLLEVINNRAHVVVNEQNYKGKKLTVINLYKPKSVETNSLLSYVKAFDNTEQELLGIPEFESSYDILVNDAEFFSTLEIEHPTFKRLEMFCITNKFYPVVIEKRGALNDAFGETRIVELKDRESLISDRLSSNEGGTKRVVNIPPNVAKLFRHRVA